MKTISKEFEWDVSNAWVTGLEGWHRVSAFYRNAAPNSQTIECILTAIVVGQRKFVRNGPRSLPSPSPSPDAKTKVFFIRGDISLLRRHYAFWSWCVSTRRFEFFEWLAVTSHASNVAATLVSSVADTPPLYLAVELLARETCTHPGFLASSTPVQMLFSSTISWLLKPWDLALLRHQLLNLWSNIRWQNGATTNSNRYL